MQREDICLRDNLIKAFDIGGAEHPLHRFRQAFAIVIGDFQAEGAGTVCDGLTDPPHSDNTERLSTQLSAQKSRRGPAAPFAAANKLDAFAYPARHADDPRHGKIGSVVGEDTWRVGHHDFPCGGSLEIDMLGPGAEIGDQAQVLAGLGQHFLVDPIGNCRDKDIALLHRLHQLVAGQWHIACIGPHVEQGVHAIFHGGTKSPCHDHAGFAVEALLRGGAG